MSKFLNPTPFASLALAPLLVVLFCFGGVCQGQESEPPPDLSATLSFLKARLEAHLTYTTTKGQFDMSTGREFRAEEFSSCDVSWKDMTVLNLSRHQELISAVKVNLGDLDPVFELAEF